MNFIGQIFPPRRGERYWEVRIPDLDIYTQGKNEKDSYNMAADAIETVVDEQSFSVKVHPLGRRRFLVSASNTTPLIARWLCCLRVRNKLTIREAALRLGANSPEAWARYESGRASPTIEKLCELVGAVEPTTRFTLRKIKLKAG